MVCSVFDAMKIFGLKWVLRGYHLLQEILVLTHWGRVPHIRFSKLTIIVSDNGLFPGRRRAIFWTNAETLLIRNLGTNFNKSLIKNHIFSSRKCIWKCRLWYVSDFVSASDGFTAQSISSAKRFMLLFSTLTEIWESNILSGVINVLQP